MCPTAMLGRTPSRPKWKRSSIGSADAPASAWILDLPTRRTSSSTGNT
jgi:hypothetical protein